MGIFFIVLLLSNFIVIPIFISLRKKLTNKWLIPLYMLLIPAVIILILWMLTPYERDSIFGDTKFVSLLIGFTCSLPTILTALILFVIDIISTLKNKLSK